MLSRSHFLRFVVCSFALGASVLDAQSSSPTPPLRWLRFPPPPAGLRLAAQPAAPRVVDLPISRFKLLDSSTGWAATDHRLLWTTDGGGHWKDISPPNPNRDSYADVFFQDQVKGWVLFSHQVKEQNDPIPHNSDSEWTFYLAATQDGGHAWTTVQLPALRDGSEGSDLSAGAQIVFGSELSGWILLVHRQSFADLLHSTDGGLHWEWVKNYPEIGGGDLRGGRPAPFCRWRRSRRESALWHMGRGANLQGDLSRATPCSRAGELSRLCLPTLSRCPNRL